MVPQTGELVMNIMRMTIRALLAATIIAGAAMNADGCRAPVVFTVTQMMTTPQGYAQIATFEGRP
jgi:hypothetical protein